MKIFLQGLVATVLFASCAEKKDQLYSTLNLNGFITIHLKSTHRYPNIPVSLIVYHSFPQADVSSVNDSLTLRRTDIYLKCPFRSVGKARLEISQQAFDLIGAPGDTIFISLGGDVGIDKEHPSVSFQGKNKLLQQYYRAKNIAVKNSMQNCMDMGINASSLLPFMKMMNNTFDSQLRFWTAYKSQHQLPEWFQTYETNAIRYSDAWLRLYILWYQIEYQKKKQVIPASYFSFMNQITSKDEQALYQYEYLTFLREQLFWKIRQLGKDLNTVNSIGDFARQEFGNNIGSFFEIWEMSRPVDNPNIIDSNFKKQFPSKYRYLVNYVQRRAQANKKVLRSGDKAPNFALVDENDSLITLNQFRGQVVYLSFWFTTCGACIKEMPYEHQLVERFKGQPVKIISICTGTPGVGEEKQLQKWKEASRKFDLRTINLFANSAWAKTLADKYMISAYPHYVLIGSDGSIIDNFAERPSQGIETKIGKQLLTEIKHLEGK